MSPLILAFALELSQLVVLQALCGLLFVLGMIFWVWMIVDCATREVPASRVPWLLAIVFIGVIAAPLYFFIRKLPRHPKTA